MNFAHGELYMLGAYFSYYLAKLLGFPPVLAVLSSIIIVFFLGVVIEVLFLRPVYTGTVERKDEYAILITFGLSIFLQNLALFVFGPWTRRSPSFMSGTTSVHSLSISNDRLFVSALAVVFMVAALIIIVRF